MTRSRILLAAAIAVALLLVLLLSAPARLLPRLAGDDALRLAGLQGSLWRGRAAQAVLVTAAGPLHLGSLRWRLRPLSLLTLSPVVQLDSEWAEQRLALQLRLGGGSLRLRDVDASVDAALARQLLPVGLRGRLSAQLSSLTWTPQGLTEAQGRLVWQQAAWESAGAVKPLGTYGAEVSSDDNGRVTARVETLAGPVLASGSLVLDGQRYAVDARIDSAGPMDPELAQALSLVAVPGENGYLLRLDGTLAPSP